MPFRFPHDIAKPQCVVVPLNKEAISPPEIALYKVPQPLELLLYSVKTLSLLQLIHHLSERLLVRLNVAPDIAITPGSLTGVVDVFSFGELAQEGMP